MLTIKDKSDIYKALTKEVKKSLNQIVEEMLNGQKLVPSLDVDLELSVEDVDISLIEEIL